MKSVDKLDKLPPGRILSKMTATAVAEPRADLDWDEALRRMEEAGNTILDSNPSTRRITILHTTGVTWAFSPPANMTLPQLSHLLEEAGERVYGIDEDRNWVLVIREVNQSEDDNV